MWRRKEKTGRELQLFGTLWRGTRAGKESEEKHGSHACTQTDRRDAKLVAISLF